MDEAIQQDAWAKEIVDAAFKVHLALGPGLLESVYEACLSHDLAKRGLLSERQVPIPIFYEGENIEPGFRADLLVQREILVELKAVETLLPIHLAQMLTYLRLARKRLGFLINFNVTKIKDGIQRVVL